ncbi:uncharacterized protein LOC113911156 [Zalophus californianus]|uniref:Uncharacterized protein LOC113911156 n=1 Tax=Zalophus californianus TaxID=9704 RepID=A0A6J2BAQ8_ZALCA|nr:uncharacterized protein LOC113911156 [Zalophus californianus]
MLKITEEQIHSSNPGLCVLCSQTGLDSLLDPAGELANVQGPSEPAGGFQRQSPPSLAERACPGHLTTAQPPPVSDLGNLSHQVSAGLKHVQLFLTRARTRSISSTFFSTPCTYPDGSRPSAALSVAGNGIPVTLHRAVILGLLGRTVYLLTGTRVSREPVPMAADMTATPGHRAQRCTSCRILQNLRYFIATLIPSVVRDRKWVSSTEVPAVAGPQPEVGLEEARMPI